jgi:hypothetical protein
LTPEIRKNIGGALLNPGLYHHALHELHKRYGNPQLVSQSCTSSLLKLQSFKDNDFNALRAFSANLHSVVATLRLGGYGMELHSHATLAQLVAKLPPALKSRWGEKSWAKQPQLSTVEDLDKWLDDVAMAEHSIRAGAMESSRSSGDPPKKSNRDGRRGQSHNVFNTTTENRPAQQSTNQLRCPCCDSTDQHHLEECQEFKSLPVEERAIIAKEKGICFRCLGRDHIGRDCSQTQRCTQPDCDAVHHPLLHGAPRMFTRETTPPAATFSGSISTESRAYAGKRTMLPMVPIILCANGKEIKLYALLDNGSEISIVKKEISDRLGLNGRIERAVTNTVDGRGKPVDTLIVNFDIISLDRRYIFNIVDAQVKETFRLSKRPIDLAAFTERWPHLAHVPIHSALEEEIAILIGHDHPAAIDIFETRKDPFHQRAPRAYLTAFGWCIGGPTGTGGETDASTFHVSSLEDGCDLQLEQFIDADTLNTKPDIVQSIGEEEKRAWNILTTTKQRDGVRHQSGPSWKTNEPILPKNIVADQRCPCLFNPEPKCVENEDPTDIYKCVIDTYGEYKRARNLKRKEFRPGIGNRCLDEIDSARICIFTHTQRNVYRQEAEDLRAGSPIEKLSDFKLSPYLNPNGILRAGRRINKVLLPLNARHPIILPRKERATEFKHRSVIFTCLAAVLGGRNRLLKWSRTSPSVSQTLPLRVRPYP